MGWHLGLQRVLVGVWAPAGRSSHLRERVSILHDYTACSNIDGELITGNSTYFFLQAPNIPALVIGVGKAYALVRFPRTSHSDKKSK